MYTIKQGRRRFRSQENNGSRVGIIERNNFSPALNGSAEWTGKKVEGLNWGQYKCGIGSGISQASILTLGTLIWTDSVTVCCGSNEEPRRLQGIH